MTPELHDRLTPDEARTWQLCQIDLTAELRSTLLTIAELRADYDAVQARYSAAWRALCAIGERLDSAGHPTLLPERALHVGDAVEGLMQETAELRATLDNERGFGLGPSAGWTFGPRPGVASLNTGDDDYHGWIKGPATVWHGPAVTGEHVWTGRSCWYWAIGATVGIAAPSARAAMRAADEALDAHR